MQLSFLRNLITLDTTHLNLLLLDDNILSKMFQLIFLAKLFGI